MRLIQSRDNPLYKQVCRLAGSARERRKTGLTLLDGIHLIAAYTQRIGEAPTLLVSESGLLQAEIADFLVGREAVRLGDALMRDVGVVETPSGILALIPEPRPRAAPAQDVDTVILDGVQDPGNLGTLLRTAAAAGFRQLLLSGDCVAAWSPKVLRAAQGAHFALDIFENADLAAFLGGFKGLSIATRPTQAVSLYELNLSVPLAWVFGSEGQGVSAEVMAQAGAHAFIPMPGEIESLNVSAAAAVCLFETLRQRSAGRI